MPYLTRDSHPLPHRQQKFKPTLACPSGLTSTSDTPINAPTYITTTSTGAQLYRCDVYTPHNPQVDALNVTRLCTHTKHKSYCQFFLDTLPRQVYLFILLGLPTLYSTQVKKMFKDAEISMPNINEEDEVSPETPDLDSSILPLHTNLKYGWESFIDSLLREYKTFNLISVLLFSAVLAILQIESAAGDPLTRFSALLSLICALISFLYGCIYIIRFGGMRKSRKVEEWVIEAQKTKESIFWNTWVLLAMPSIWLAWSVLFFMVGILSFVWRTGTTASDNSPPVITSRDILGPRIAITIVFGVGLAYFVFIFSTFKRYANAMDGTRTTYVKNQFPKNVAPPTNQRAQPADQQTPQPRRHHSYPPYKAPGISNMHSTVTLQGLSGADTPVSIMYADEQQNISLSPHQTKPPSDSM